MMKKVLLTGTSGFLGSNLAKDLKNRGFEVLSISRKEVVDDVGMHVQGNFADYEDLEKLNLDGSESLVHLAAVTGDASEEDAMRVNVYETSRLVRYCVEKGIKKIVLASSIAVVGCLTEDFIPRELPIQDDHPCDSSNPYGLSKYLMEEYLKYVKRNHPDLDITLFRIGVVLKRTAVTPNVDQISKMWRPFCTLGCIHVDDVVGAFSFALERNFSPSFGIYNLVAEDSFSSVPTIEALKLSLGEKINQLDLSAYKRLEQSNKGLYDISKLIDNFGFRPKIKVSNLKAQDAGA
jgi:nucleoside-diphosphate-sugar epimerase